jgi:hypothetical protein
LTWTAPGDDGTAGQATQYDIRYSLAPINDASWGSATQIVGEPNPQAAGATETFVVTDLVPSTEYYFAIKAADEIPNWSGLSNVVSGATTAGNSAVLAYYPFSGDASDASGNGNHGTVHGAILTQDQSGVPSSAYYFDGVDDYIDLGAGIDLRGESFSISFMSKRENPEEWGYVLTQGNTSAADSMLVCGFTDSNMFKFGFFGDDLDIAGPFLDTGWHQWTCTYDVTTRARVVFRDGVEVGSDIANADYGGSGQLFIGATLRPIVPENTFQGAIDELYIRRGVYQSGVSADPVPVLVNLRVLPNPAHSRVSVQLAFQGHGTANVRIYDVSGRQVASLLDRSVAGHFTVDLTWDGRAGGVPAGPGVYFIVADTPVGRQSRKLVLLGQ